MENDNWIFFGLIPAGIAAVYLILYFIALYIGG